MTGQDFAQEMERTCLKDLERSREVSLADWRDWRRRPATHKFIGQLACRFKEWF